MEKQLGQPSSTVSAADERRRAGMGAVSLAVSALETAIGLLPSGQERETVEMCRDVLLGLGPPKPAPRPRSQ